MQLPGRLGSLRIPPNLFATRPKVALLANMGFPDRPAGTPDPSAPGNGSVALRLAAAREKLDAKDLAGAVEIYEEVLAGAGDRADVLVTISGDLGSTGNIRQIVELVAPRYDAKRHGPATGINLIQAYLAVGDADAAQHVLDILYALNHPGLEERLHGFSNAVAELMNKGYVCLLYTSRCV